ncbi:cytochrome c oxidase assembly protein [Halomonas organivorans]|uniref:Putative membrane protein n=1 Tax=Halomonas organivorans TaxID=257772 RepID=A0A7W5BVR2_9GAMM|nr:cytochrome c oxidase assembly protein [Halomonas organivorans]MBB3140020.1 putative membrane protein [Halomonas organivorans]
MAESTALLHSMTTWLAPWEFSPLWGLACLTAAIVYMRGARRLGRHHPAVGWSRPIAFLAGLALVYIVTQTHYDYLSQYMFFPHRAQHLVLHHAAPFLMALALPGAALAAGLPMRIARPSRRLRPLVDLLQHPLVAPLLFVGLIYFWLIPEVHFNAMLSQDLYQLMNWSMFIDGVLFWWLVLTPSGRLGHGRRILLLLAVVPPQILLGAYLTFSPTVLFDVYEVCGRAWPLAPLVDQQIGGLITWIPATMMSVIGTLIVLRQLRRDETRRQRMPPSRTPRDVIG